MKEFDYISSMKDFSGIKPSKTIQLLFFIGLLGNINALNAAPPTPPLHQDFLKKVDLKSWKKYADNLKNCTAGNFSLPDPLAISVITIGVDMANSANVIISQDKIDKMLAQSHLSYHIVGLDNHKCKVIITPAIFNAVKHPSPIECLFEQTERTILSERAEKISKGAFQILGNDAERHAIIHGCVLK